MDSDDSIDVTLKKLNSSKDGLSESQAEERQIKYGLNEIKGRKKSRYRTCIKVLGRNTHNVVYSYSNFCFSWKSN